MSHTTTKQFDKWYEELTNEQLFYYTIRFTIDEKYYSCHDNFIKWLEKVMYNEGDIEGVANPFMRPTHLGIDGDYMMRLRRDGDVYRDVCGEIVKLKSVYSWNSTTSMLFEHWKDCGSYTKGQKQIIKLFKTKCDKYKLEVK